MAALNEWDQQPVQAASVGNVCWASGEDRPARQLATGREFPDVPIPEVGDVRRSTDEGESVELSETPGTNHFCERTGAIYPPHLGATDSRFVEGDKPDFAAARVQRHAGWCRPRRYDEPCGGS